MCCIYRFSSHHVQNTYCAKNIHIKQHTYPHSIFQDEFLMPLGQDDWQTKFFFFFSSRKNIFTLIIHSCFIKQDRVEYEKTMKKNPFVLSIIILNWMKQNKISSYFPLHPFYYFVKIFPIYNRKVVVFVLHESRAKALSYTSSSID